MNDYRRQPRRKFGLLNFGFAQQPGIDGPSQYDAAGLGARPRLQTPVAWKPNDDKWGPTGLLNIEYGAKRAIVDANPEAKRNFNTILQEATGGAFTSDDMKQIEREVIDNLSPKEAAHFRNAPAEDEHGSLLLNDRQWAIIENTVSGFPKDELGMKARDKYREAIAKGRIRRR